MNERIEKSLYDILAAVANIDAYLAERGRNFNTYLADGLLRHGIERNLEIIGEATNRILKADPAFSLTHARSIVDLRNRRQAERRACLHELARGAKEETAA